MKIASLSFDEINGFSVSIHWIILFITALATIAYLIIKRKYFKNSYSEFEIDEAEIGIGNHKIKGSSRESVHGETHE